MQKIIPHLWFEKESIKIAEFYVSAFGGDSPRQGEASKIKTKSVLHSTPSGDVDVVSFDLLGQSFMAIGAGPTFKPNPSISFSVAYKTKEEVDALWEKLVEGAKVMMELGTYPYSERYGWLEDKYGVSWQIIAMGENPIIQNITPSFLFVGEVAGKAEEAMNFYASVFPDSKVGDIARYAAGMEPDKEGAVLHGVFTLAGQQFIAMDSAQDHKFSFKEGVSLMVNCKDQAEIDYFWEKLSADPKAEQCGWLKDKYGVSWQIVPIAMGEMMGKGSKEQIDRVTQAFLPMKKFDIATLERAYNGE